MVTRNMTSRSRKHRVSNLSGKLAALAGASGAALSSDAMAITYTPTAGVLAAQGIPGFAYTSATNVTSGTLRPPASLGYTPWDVDGNSQVDFQLTHTSSSSQWAGIQGHSVFPNAPNGLVQNNNSFLVNFGSAGAPVDAAASWRGFFNSLTIDGVNNAPGFTTGVPGFFGFRFKPDWNASDYYYGWGSLTIDLASPRGQGFKITEAYYQSTPNTAIQVGQAPNAVPEPSSLVLLAIGSTGVAAWRTRRKQPSGDA